jgi:hypothetical protein
MSLTAEQRGALAMLATAGHNGATQPLLAADGFGVAMVADLVNQGLATMTYEKVRASGKLIEVSKIRITTAGRDALVESFSLSRPTDWRESKPGAFWYPVAGAWSFSTWTPGYRARVGLGIPFPRHTQYQRPRAGTVAGKLKALKLENSSYRPIRTAAMGRSGRPGERPAMRCSAMTSRHRLQACAHNLCPAECGPTDSGEHNIGRFRALACCPVNEYARPGVGKAAICQTMSWDG